MFDVARKGRGLLALTLFAAFTGRATADTPKTYSSPEDAFYQLAPRVIQRLREAGHANVGVLKFLVNRAGKADFDDNAGPLNTVLARRLEMALIVKNDKNEPLDILVNASAIAANNLGKLSAKQREGLFDADHPFRLSPRGFQFLFDAEYPLAWGNRSAKPSAMVSGFAGVSADLRQLSIDLFTINSSGKATPLGERLVAAMDPARLSEIGESFRSSSSGKLSQSKRAPTTNEVKTIQNDAFADAEKVIRREEPFPLQAADGPLAFELRYDGKVIPLEVRGGKAFAPEPSEGQKFSIHIRRRLAGPERIGVVVKVNGENTIAQQRLSDAKCRKWILGPGHDEHEIFGYQSLDQTMKLFRVLSVEDSAKAEMKYGADVGTISVTVFAEKSWTEPPVIKTPEADVRAILETVELPEVTPSSYDALMTRMRAKLLEKGVPVPGTETVDSKVNVVPFAPAPVPLLTATVVVYLPKNRSGK